MNGLSLLRPPAISTQQTVAKRTQARGLIRSTWRLPLHMERFIKLSLAKYYFAARTSAGFDVSR
jgi:hypothetical protein